MSTAQNWQPGWQLWRATLEAGLHVFCAGDAESGPTALISAGVHGDEYEGPAAVAALARELAGVSLSGRVLLAPAVNPFARVTGTRETQEDGKNLARTFPGKGDGSVTERLAEAVFTHLVLPSDFIIDLHSGGVDHLFLPVAGFYGESRPDNPSYASARLFGLPALWYVPPTPGVLSYEAMRLGKVAIGHEYLGAGQLSQEGARAYAAGVKNCLKGWSILAGEPAGPTPGQICYRGDWMLSTASGLFIPYVDLGRSVEEGALLASICNERGEVMESVHAPFAGDVVGLRSKAHVHSGGKTILVAKREDLA